MAPNDDATDDAQTTILRGSTDRHGYHLREDGFTDGYRVELVYESPYSGTEVTVEGTARDVSATSFTLELDDGREWGVFSGESGGIRTTENSRRASGRTEAKNGRTVGYVRRLRVYEVVADDEDEDDEQDDEVRTDGGQVEDVTTENVEEFAEDVDLSDLSDDDLDRLDDRVGDLLNGDPYEFPTDTALSAAFSLSTAIRDEKESRDPRRDDPYFHPGDTEERFALPVTSVEVYEEGDEVRARITLDETGIDGGRDAPEWRLRPGTEIAATVLDYYGVDALNELGTVVGDTLPVVGADRFPWGRVDRYALEHGTPAVETDDDADDTPEVRTDGGQDAAECEECGTTDDVRAITYPETDTVFSRLCGDCLDEQVAEIEADREREAREEADAFEGVTVKSRGNLSPAASHVRRIVEETFRDYLAAGKGVYFADEPTLWDRGDYGTNAHGDPYGVVFTLGFQDHEVRDAFFHAGGEGGHYENYPEGVESRLNSGYFEQIYGFAFEYVEA